MAEPESPQPVARPHFLAKYGRFVVVGLTGFVVNLVVFAVVLDALSPSPTFSLIQSVLKSASTKGGNPQDFLIASAVAFGVATLWNFFLNNLWTFRTTVGHRHPIHHRLGLYYAVSLASLGINEAVLYLLSSLVPILAAQAIGILAGSAVGFVGNYRVTFEEASPDAIPPGTS